MSDAASTAPAILPDDAEARLRGLKIAPWQVAKLAEEATQSLCPGHTVWNVRGGLLVGLVEDVLGWLSRAEGLSFSAHDLREVATLEWLGALAQTGRINVQGEAAFPRTIDVSAKVPRQVLERIRVWIEELPDYDSSRGFDDQPEAERAHAFSQACWTMGVNEAVRRALAAGPDAVYFTEGRPSVDPLRDGERDDRPRRGRTPAPALVTDEDARGLAVSLGQLKPGERDV